MSNPGMDRTRRLTVLHAIYLAAEDQAYKGATTPLVALALQYGGNDRVTRAEVKAVLRMQVIEAAYP